MVRTVLYLLATVFVIALLRGVIGLISKGVAGLFDEEARAAGSGSSRKGSFGGELRQDPVCGTYVSTQSALTKTIGGETHYFCSAGCRDRFSVKAS
jgi:YHS domain-containing protein